MGEKASDEGVDNAAAATTAKIKMKEPEVMINAARKIVLWLDFNIMKASDSKEGSKEGGWWPVGGGRGTDGRWHAC